MSDHESNPIPHPPDDNTLIVLVALHVVVRVVRDREDVRRHLSDLLVSVRLDVLRPVDRQDLVRVDGHEDRTRVCLGGEYQ